MKFNWGTGIVLFFVLFLGSVGWRVYISLQQEINLTSDDYYIKGVQYQKQIDKQKNTLNLTEKIKISLSSDSLTVRFPDFFRNKKVVGKITLYRPSDYRIDINYDIKLDTANSQKLIANNLLKGKYIVKIDWRTDSISYYQEQDLDVK